MDYLEYKGYRGSIEYSLADKCFVGQVQGLGKKVLILYEGNTIDELRKDFEEAVDFYLESCRERHVAPEIPSYTKVNLRMPSELHARIAAYAAGADITINEFINRLVRHELEHEGAF